MYLTYHYVTDVIAGALVAILAIALDVLLWQKGLTSPAHSFTLDSES
jgi:membrane-associated phospholipid phosphatase